MCIRDSPDHAHTALDRCQRGHRQGLDQPARGAEEPRRARRTPLRGTARPGSHRRMRMNLADLVAIDVHTHAWKSALRVDAAPSESQEAMGRYFRYQPQHQTVPEMAEMYRKLKMGFVVFTVDSPREVRKITNEEIAELAHQHG